MQIEFNKKLVSVIIPAYKCERYVKACIDSILKQTYKHIEVIAVYDPSPDNTWAVLEKYKEHVILAKQKRKTNPATARNVGLEIAKGEYIAFCDADDYFEKTKIESQIRVIEGNRVDITYTDVVLVDENDIIIERRICPEISPRLIGSWVASPFITLSSILVKKESLEKVGRFDENLDVAEDADLLLKLIFFSKIIKKTPGFLTFHRERSGSLSSSLRILTDLNRIKMFKKQRLSRQILLELPTRLLPDIITGLLIRPKEVSQELLYIFRGRRRFDNY